MIRVITESDFDTEVINYEDIARKSIEFYEELCPYEFWDEEGIHFKVGNTDYSGYIEKFKRKEMVSDELYNLKCTMEEDGELFEDDRHLLDLYNEYYDALMNAQYR